MTLPEILNCYDPELLESITDAQAVEIFSPYFPVTRPDQAALKDSSKDSKILEFPHKDFQDKSRKPMSQAEIIKRSKLNEAKKLLAKFNIKV